MIIIRSWWRPNLSVKNLRKISLAPVFRQIGCSCGTLSWMKTYRLPIMADIQGNPSLQHLLVNAAIHIHSFNEYQGLFRCNRIDSGPKPSDQMVSIAWNVFWHFRIGLVVDYSLCSERLIVHPKTVTRCISSKIFFCLETLDSRILNGFIPKFVLTIFLCDLSESSMQSFSCFFMDFSSLSWRHHWHPR